MKRALRAGAFAIAASLVPAPAFAHGTLKIGEFYTGLSQPLFHFESLLILLAVLLWSVQRGGEALVRVPSAFALATLAGSALALAGVDLPATTLVMRGGTLLFALLVAARIGLPGFVAIALAVALGVAAGHEATWSDRADLTRPWLYTAGLGAAVIVLWGYVASFALRFRAFWAEVALRVVASWIATVTLLVSALALAKR